MNRRAARRLARQYVASLIVDYLQNAGQPWRDWYDGQGAMATWTRSDVERLATELGALAEELDPRFTLRGQRTKG